MNADALPVDVLHWASAASPIILLLVLLAVLRWKAPEAGPVGLALSVLVAIVLYEAGAQVLAVAGGKGVWDAIFILLVVWPALLLYRVAEGSGALEAMRQGIAAYSRNDVFLILAFGWVFASFLQGIAGFGAPIAVVAPLLLAFGVKPLWAVVIPLIGHAWANMFGTLAVGWLATLAVVDLQNETATAVQTAVLLWIPNLVGGVWIAWLVGRGAAIRNALPMIAVISVIHGGGQLALMLFDPVLSTFLASTVAMVALIPLARWKRYSEPVEDVELEVMSDERPKEEDAPEPVMGLGMALLPYAVLTVVAVGALVIDPIQQFLEGVEYGPAFPAVETGLGYGTEAEEQYQPFTPFTHPGFFLLVSAVAAYAVYQARGVFAAWSERTGERKSVVGTAVSDAVAPSVAIVAFLILSQVLAQTGQTEVLALGLDAVAPPLVYASLSALIGVLGAFMTSSNTASNILFADLQASVAQAGGLSEPAIIAAQSTGGAIGNCIAPANIALGTGTVQAVGQEGAVLRKTLPFAAVVTVLVGAGTVALEVLA